MPFVYQGDDRRWVSDFQTEAFISNGWSLTPPSDRGPAGLVERNRQLEALLGREGLTQAGDPERAPLDLGRAGTSSFGAHIRLDSEGEGIQIDDMGRTLYTVDVTREEPAELKPSESVTIRDEARVTLDDGRWRWAVEGHGLGGGGADSPLESIKDLAKEREGATAFNPTEAVLNEWMLRNEVMARTYQWMSTAMGAGQGVPEAVRQYLADEEGISVGDTVSLAYGTDNYGADGLNANFEHVTMEATDRIMAGMGWGLHRKPEAQLMAQMLFGSEDLDAGVPPMGQEDLENYFAGLGIGGGGGGGYSRPPYQAPDPLVVEENVRAFLVAMVGTADEARVQEYVDLWLRTDKRAWEGESVDPAAQVRDQIRKQADYKQIHQLRPEGMDEMNWLNTQWQGLAGAGVESGMLDSESILQAKIGVSPGRAGVAGLNRAFQRTGRALPAFMQQMRTAARNGFSRVI